MLRLAIAFNLAIALTYGALLAMKAPKVRLYGNKDFSEQGEVLLYKGKPFTGTTIETFPKGTTYRSTEYKNGLKEGTCEEFGVDGELRARYHYELGKREGKQYGWFLEGPRKFEMNYKNGLLEGVYTEWYMSGTVLRQQNFHEGVQVAQKILFPTGEVFSNFVIRNTRKFGLDSGPLCMDFKKEGEI